MTELEDQSKASESSRQHKVAKPKSSGKSEKSQEDESDSDLSNYSFDLTAAEIAQIKRDYDRDPDRIAED